VLRAVATAEGFTYRADQRHVYLKHSGDSKETRYTLDADILVQPGDTLRIGERYF
jgi:polysaccharide export outer membrane protein